MNGSRLMCRLAAAVAVLISPIVTAGPMSAGAGGMWTDPIVVSRADTDVRDAKIAANQRGDVVAVWTRIGAGPTVEFARLDAGSDRWTTPTILSPAAWSPLAYPSVAIEPDGDAIVVWEQSSATDRTVVARHFSRAANAWSNVVALDTPDATGMSLAMPMVVVDALGNALAAWSAIAPGGTVLHAAWFDVATGTWAAPTTLTTPAWIMRPTMAVDGTGDVTLAWYRFVASETVVEAIRYDAATRTFGAMVELDRAPAWGPAYSPTVDLGVDAAGNVLAAFDHAAVSGVNVRVRRFETGTSSWAAPVDLTPAGLWASGARVAVLPSGDAVAVWRQFNTMYALRSARYTAASHTWSSAIDVGTVEVGEWEGSVVLATDGTATVVWSELRTDAVVTRTATSRPDGAWQDHETLSVRISNDLDRPQQVSVIDGAGTVTVAWRALDGVAEALLSVQSVAVGVPDFVPVSPVRVFDTRAGESPDAVRLVPKVKVGGGSVLEVKVTDLAGVVPASGVGAVSLNVTVTNPEGAGFVTVYPCGPRALVSSVNYGSGATVANAVIAPVSASGTVCFFSMVPTDLIVDLNGWFPAG